MATPKRTMCKNDVEAEICSYVRQNFKKLKIVGKEKPDQVNRVLTTIQDPEYYGAGKYFILLELWGDAENEKGDFQQNNHYTTSCHVKITANSEGSPIPEIDEDLIFTKQKY